MAYISCRVSSDEKLFIMPLPLSSSADSDDDQQAPSVPRKNPQSYSHLDMSIFSFMRYLFRIFWYAFILTAFIVALMNCFKPTSSYLSVRQEASISICLVIIGNFIFGWHLSIINNAERDTTRHSPEYLAIRIVRNRQRIAEFSVILLYLNIMAGTSLYAYGYVADPDQMADPFQYNTEPWLSQTLVVYDMCAYLLLIPLFVAVMGEFWWHMQLTNSKYIADHKPRASPKQVALQQALDRHRRNVHKLQCEIDASTDHDNE